MEENRNLEDLESAINAIPKPENSMPMNPVQETKTAPEQAISPEQEVGFHKGALTTLINERNELLKMIANVENVMQMHVGRLKELGVDVK